MSSEETDVNPGDPSRSADASGAGGWSRRHPRVSRLIWITAGLGVLALLIWAIYPKPQMRRHFNMTPQSVGVATAKSEPIDVTLSALGTVTPLTTATVKPQVSGLLTKLYFKEGQTVQAGDPLAQIDPKPYQAALDRAKGQLAKDAASLANAKADLKRYEPLAHQHAISIQQLATQQALVRSDNGTVEADKAAVETAAINLAYTRIVSPVAGSVGLHLVDVGNMVQAGQATGIVVVTELSPMSVIFSVPEDNIAAIEARFSAGAVLEADAWDRSQTTKVASGKLAAIDNVVDPATGTVKLRAIFANTNRKLFPGQFVNVRLRVDTLDHQTVVPMSAIQRGPDGDFVFLVKSDHTVHQRSITPGVQDGDKVAIVKGLAPGDTVVIDGADRLRDGAPVTIPGASAEKTAAAPVQESGERAMRNRFRQFREEFAKNCRADFAKLCAGQTGRDGMRCLIEHRTSLSAACRTTLESMRRDRRRAAAF